VTGSNAPVLLAYDGSPSSAVAIAAAGRLVNSHQRLLVVPPATEAETSKEET
jgi:hypothetical protein